LEYSNLRGCTNIDSLGSAMQQPWYEDGRCGVMKLYYPNAQKYIIRASSVWKGYKTKNPLAGVFLAYETNCTSTHDAISLEGVNLLFNCGYKYTLFTMHAYKKLVRFLSSNFDLSY
jgi:hypothetical protein